MSKTTNNARLKELTHIIWGDNIKQEVFDRWSQGFIFDSQNEPTALLQYSGGPCSIIATVQGFLLRELLFETKCDDCWQKTTDEELNNHLANSFMSIFINVTSEHPKYLVLYEKEETTIEDQENAFVDKETEPSTSNQQNNENENPIKNDEKKRQPSLKRIKLDYEAFVKSLKVFEFETLNEMKVVLKENINLFRQDYGVLCFLYSLLLTKGIEELKKELEESHQSLIDPLHGHGSQNLTNLMLCGLATPNVFDGVKSLEGLKLQGIPKQSTIGFLTIMEYLRYLEVGWNLKNPKTPIWLLASETHLSVFFSREQSLIQKNEIDRQHAIVNFQKYDPHENGFLKTEDLEKLMESLDLLTDKEYVEVVKQQLDSENLGIITKSAFLNEFYPESEPNMIPSSFPVFHYNGLIRPNSDSHVMYSKGIAKVIDFTDQASSNKTNSILNCLQTKWPTMEIEWSSQTVPSLN